VLLAETNPCFNETLREVPASWPLQTADSVATLNTRLSLLRYMHTLDELFSACVLDSRSYSPPPPFTKVSSLRKIVLHALNFS
jgi:hypothetical protein